MTAKRKVKNGSIYIDKPRFNFYKPQQEAYMPIEFAAAAYRFGHSMVRPIYRLNLQLNSGDKDEATVKENERGVAGRFFIFAGVQNRGLNGFDKFPDNRAIDWSLFFDINGSGKKTGKNRVQPSYKIDPSLVNPLGFLPEFSKVAIKKSGHLTIANLQSKESPDLKPSNLAVRNLLRGMAMALPSGEDVARAMGREPLKPHELLLCKATVEDCGNKNTPNMLTFAGGAFKDKTPLWYYILAEAMHDWYQIAKEKDSKGDEEPLHLGEVGGRIVAETLIGLVLSDSHSYLRQDPNWTPKSAGFIKDSFDMGGLIKYALKL